MEGRKEARPGCRANFLVGGPLSVPIFSPRAILLPLKQGHRATLVLVLVVSSNTHTNSAKPKGPDGGPLSGLWRAINGPRVAITPPTGLGHEFLSGLERKMKKGRRRKLAWQVGKGREEKGKKCLP